jgi:hypothetical protein
MADNQRLMDNLGALIGLMRDQAAAAQADRDRDNNVRQEEREAQRAATNTQQLILDNLVQAQLNLPGNLEALTSRGDTDKPEKPAKYDGKERYRLPAFRTACSLYFLRLPHKFTTDKHKVLFVGERLDGKAGDWFTQNFANDATPPWINHYPQFLEALKVHYGLPDEVAYAEKKIEALRMSDKDHFDIHLTRFEEWKVVIGDQWSDRTYWKVFLNSLAPRVRNYLTNRESGTPETYANLSKVVTEYDKNYWTLHNTLTPFDTPSVKAEPRTPRFTPASTSATPKAPNPLSAVLGADGKLLQSEKDRRLKLGLCMACGQPGHMAVACTNVKKSAGAAAITTSTTTTSTTNKTNVAPASTSKARATFTVTGDASAESQIEEVGDSDSDVSEN